MFWAEPFAIIVPRISPFKVNATNAPAVAVTDTVVAPDKIAAGTVTLNV